MFGLEKRVTILDFIGFNGPFVLSGIACILMYKKVVVLLTYFIFLGLSLFLSKIAKQLIKEPRPDQPLAYFVNESHLYSNEESYGMPSAHATLAAFSVIYFYLFLGKWTDPVFIVSMIIYGLTLYQRWKYRRHTILQLIAGTVLGLTVGVIGSLQNKI
jgi:membrane-associated phospholipid phosphatase